MQCGEPARLHNAPADPILDASPEPNFDRIAQLATTIFGIPSVLVLLDTDRPCLKSSNNLAAHDHSHALALSGQLAPNDRAVVWPDLHDDGPLLPLHSRTHLRFYAGAPLLTAQGTCIGSLGLVDAAPHFNFGKTELAILVGLAEMVVELVEARTQQMRLIERTREIAHLAHQDPLTELGNRRHLDRLLNDAVKQVRPNEQIVVYYVDLDGFKRVNDSLGHGFGDLLLREVTKRLRGQMGAGDTVARIGGDEFAIMQCSERAAAEAPGFANGIIKSVARPYGLNGQMVRIGTSIGASIGRFPAPSPEQMLKEADQALYRAKAAGRGRFALFDNSRPAGPARFALSGLRFDRSGSPVSARP